MGNVYDRIAMGIEMLTKRYSRSWETRIPIGLDGAVIEHLIYDFSKSRKIPYNDNLENTVEISSKENNADIKKFNKVLESIPGNSVFGIDMRSKTGSLRKMIRELNDEWNRSHKLNKEIRYLVIYDKSEDSHYCVFNEELTDDQRINWFSSDSIVRNIFHKSDDSWREKYELSHDSLAKISAVRKISNFF